jgi:CheY-like chemotaxis protein
MSSVPWVVLYVEDEENDRFLVERAFVKEGLGSVLRMVAHGQGAIDYLSGAGVYADREEYPLPGVVLLDLNLPEVHGFDVLKWIRAHPHHRNLPVVVFTSSARDEDREQAQALGANEFVQKPGLASLFQEVARRLSKQWLEHR